MTAAMASPEPSTPRHRPQRTRRHYLVASYHTPTAGGWDEMVDGGGRLRPQWSTLAGELDRIGGASELGRRGEHAQRLIRENGVTYNVYGDPRGLDRPWQLDPLPQVIGGAEWDRVAAGLAQRAHLLDLILADCYGSQRLLHDGLLPPAVLFAHPGFLRPYHELQVPGGRRLHLYAADMLRGPEGQWRVLADRAQAPSGAGYALENRIVLSRALPEVYRECRVRRLAAFFAATRDTLIRLAPRHRDNPRIVLLTPGPYNESYFEHAYLARYLGYTLVEGGDLTVRDDSVFLKTLGGLHPVDVILRRLDDDFSDPLELRNESTLGVAGLVQAARSGNVAIVNALGSGLAQNAALMPLLPGLCRHVLSEDLILPSVESWWCGGSDGLPRTLDHLARLVIKPAFGPGRGEPRFGRRLDAAQRAELRARIAARPYAFLAQEEMLFSSTPVWSSGGLQPRPMALRAFAVATSDAYAVMPGGLTRISGDPNLPMVSMQRGGGSKDTWVLSDGPVEHISLLRPVGAAVELRRGGIDLPSRVADNLFWFGRYAERAEDCARLLRAAVLRLADDPGSFAGRELSGLVATLRRVGLLPADAPAPENPAEAEDLLLALLHDDVIDWGMPANLHRLHHAAFAVRDRLSNDTWRVVNHLDRRNSSHETAADGEPAWATAPAAAQPQLIANLAALAGMGMENTTRGPGWRFLDLGRRLERAMFTADLLRALLAVDDGDAGLDLLLDIADSGLTYRSRYLTTLQPAAVLDLLLTDVTNPRSLAFQLQAHRHRPCRPPPAARQARPRAALGRGAPGARRSTPSCACPIRSSSPPPAMPPGSATLLDRLSEDLVLLSDSITRAYLSHLVSSPRTAARAAPATCVRRRRRAKADLMRYRVRQDDHLPLPRNGRGIAQPGRTWCRSSPRASALPAPRGSPSARRRRPHMSGATTTATAPPPSPSSSRTTSWWCARSARSTPIRGAPLMPPPARPGRRCASSSPAGPAAARGRAAPANSPTIRRSSRAARRSPPTPTPASRPAGPCSMRRTSSTSASMRSSPTIPPRPRCTPRSMRCWRSAAGCARTSPISPSAACARSAWPRATSAATSRPCPRKGASAWWAPMPRMPGSRSTARILRMGGNPGSISIPPTTASPGSATSACGGGAGLRRRQPAQGHDPRRRGPP